MEFTVSSEAFDLISIGGGSGGLACAQQAARYRARAAVIESGALGGTCVNVGCVPKKVMWNAASIALSLADASDYGFDVAVGGNDWGALKRGRDAYVVRLNGIYERNLAAKGVTLVRGFARFIDAHTVEVNGVRMKAPHIVIASGGFPAVPRLPGAERGITSNGFFALERRPHRVAIAGSGAPARKPCGSLAGLVSISIGGREPNGARPHAAPEVEGIGSRAELAGARSWRSRVGIDVARVEQERIRVGHVVRVCRNIETIEPHACPQGQVIEHRRSAQRRVDERIVRVLYGKQVPLRVLVLVIDAQVREVPGPLRKVILG